jgi:cytochrome c-type biogenesis protein CcmH
MSLLRAVVFALKLVPLVLLCLPAAAVQPDEILADPQLEARARVVSKDLRCLVCQNQSIDDSNAVLARDLRILVRERLKEGDSNAAALQFIVARYGDYVLLDPPFKLSTYVLWLGPGLFAFAGLIAVFLFFRNRRAQAAAPAPLSAEERRQLDDLLKQDAP